MPRRSKPYTILYEYAAQTDVERCARALLRLLGWEPPPGASTAAAEEAPGTSGTAPQADHHPEETKGDDSVSSSRRLPEEYTQKYMYSLESKTILNGAQVRTLRHRLQLTQQELALTCGLYQQHISALERGIYTAVRTPTLAALAAALGVEITELVVEETRAGG